MSVPYAVACKFCGYVERFSWERLNPEDPTSEYLRMDGSRLDANTLRPIKALTERGRVNVICGECGALRPWRMPATAEDIAKHDAKQKRRERATVLCKEQNIDGLLKLPEEIRAAPEVKIALSNLIGPLEGETLKVALMYCLRVAKSGAAVPSEVWVEMYDQAVQRAIKETAPTKAKATA